MLPSHADRHTSARALPACQPSRGINSENWRLLDSIFALRISLDKLRLTPRGAGGKLDRGEGGDGSAQLDDERSEVEVPRHGRALQQPHATVIRTRQREPAARTSA